MPDRQTSDRSPPLHHDPVHDPGPADARRRADALPQRKATVITPAGGGRIRIGTAGWTDPTLTAPGVFYPEGATTPETRLRYYAGRFPLVEVDSPYYALPTPQMARRWVERTPRHFTFNVKAHALMTGQPTEVKRLPRELRDALPKSLAAAERVYAKDLPAEINDAVWALFREALVPLHASGKLGAVLLQYPRWFLPSRENADALIDAKTRLGDMRCAVEFRNQRWLNSERRVERTLGFLKEHDLPYVVVDEPQGLLSSVPPILAVTSDRLAMLRMHGRRAETWEKRNVTVAERYRYLYDREQLAEWAPKVSDLAAQAAETHVVFNNCYANYGTTNAVELTELLLGSAAR
jgi:uncharacterized protein YecE (DUF72 family)